ncbi:MAG: succinylglutamate desuccinylase [Gammaproteobacteria bacterium RIFCSPLOWO2_02_FULL_47_50]|jgi:hypothetical protein|nr:MAG: succinylglutamate desuccinylase [Gammaproteobacteria bacterium RIFCSPLOWO2_01_FULL_47_190]OGT76384.1 MAG: succinylglutamate desuccinylase [Gammaproteobacteria bacterium RIFCSPLOWO2_12_47_11]OGT79238.1 MAG: succinylglutamate desuccinylase [Gammaproteobacteria bacterium RIFCSPLOWO2_02_FULL_47_50]OGT82953.1 MAG: succinylglutamate desuccinylase [Gammaproteobacteria bacterium RIFCSPLOWO2_12_FULL_47_76]
MKSRKINGAGYKPVEIGGVCVKPGNRAVINLRIPSLYTHPSLTMPVQVVHGKTDGPRLFVSAAIHGDEINGVEIIRRLLKLELISKIKGTLIAVPVVNVYGFINQSRYLPDRRDLNRSFPGSKSGSLAARLAHIFLNEIASNATHGIDLHTAAFHRDNLPHVRAFLDDEETRRIAHAFSTPVILNTSLTEGSLRKSLKGMNIPVIVYEAGEALRFNEFAICAGVNGIVSVMRELGMLPESKSCQMTKPLIAKSSVWVRAEHSGIFRNSIPLGAVMKKGQVLGVITDQFGVYQETVRSSISGIVIGRTNMPLVHEGEALFHIARSGKTSSFVNTLEVFQQEIASGER